MRYYQQPSRPLFQSAIHKRYVSIHDARDAYESCRKIISHEDRMTCYEMFGVDGENVEKYLHIVESLNVSMEHTDQYEKFQKTKLIRIGPFHLYIGFFW